MDENLHFNGIDATTGAPLFEPLSPDELASAVLGETPAQAAAEAAHRADLKLRAGSKDGRHYGVKEGIDPARLEQTGWGVIFPAVEAGSAEEREQEAIREALAPLLALRRAQAARIDERYYQEYRGERGYRRGESKQDYLARLGAGPGPADPAKVPYYLLLVGSPEAIPYPVQYQIDVQYAVGRLHFDAVEEYAHYARSVVTAETSGLVLPREVAFVGVANFGDTATRLSRHNLIEPLAELAEGWTDVPGWKVSRYFDEDADKATVSQLLGGPRTPALLFTGSHGAGFPKGDPLQLRRQGALLLQDWGGPGSGPLTEDLYFSGDDVPSDAGMHGLIAFNFACYSAGTPEHDEFARKTSRGRKAIADRPFVAGLHKKLLGHPRGGALATIGHVDRAWACSFQWGEGLENAQLAVFESTLKALMKGLPVGAALEYFNERYAELASDLSQKIDELDFEPEAVDKQTLAGMWMSSKDARGYAVVGDPAVRLCFADGPPGDARERALAVPIVGRAAVAAAPAPRGERAGDGPEARADALTAPTAETRESVVAKLLAALGQPLEVRTYASADPAADAALDRAALARAGKLWAFTRVLPDGSVDVIVSDREGAADAALLGLHVEAVKQAQAGRVALQEAALASIARLPEPDPAPSDPSPRPPEP